MQESQLRSKQPSVIINKGGVNTVYPLTVEDYTDLARAVEREGPPKLAVAWTLLQRFGLLYPLYPGLSKFVKAYAQPINPQWFSNGAAHLAELKRLGGGGTTAGAKENTQASQREGWAKTPLAKISQDTLAVLDSIFEGKPSPVPLASHYAAPITRTNVDAAKAAREAFATKRGYTPVPIGNILTDNWFYSEAAMASVKVVTSASNPSPASAFGTFVALGLGSYGLLYIARRLWL